MNMRPLPPHTHKKVAHGQASTYILVHNMKSLLAEKQHFTGVFGDQYTRLLSIYAGHLCPSPLPPLECACVGLLVVVHAMARYISELFLLSLLPANHCCKLWVQEPTTPYMWFNSSRASRVSYIQRVSQLQHVVS